MGDLSKYDTEDIINIITSDAETELRNRGYEFGWYMPITFVGVIYILVNPAFPDLVKIGYTDDIEKRLKSLNSNSGLPDPFHCYAIYKVQKKLADLKLHKLIDSLDSDLRHSKNKEFYEMDCSKAFEILSAIAQITGNEEQLILNPLKDDYFGGTVTTTSPTAKGQIPDGDYYFDREIKRWGGNHAKGTLRVKDGKLTLLKGAILNPISSGDNTVHTVEKKRAEAVIKDNVLQEDIDFASPSGAGGFLIYGTNDGWRDWKTADGQPIEIFKKGN